MRVSGSKRKFEEIIADEATFKPAILPLIAMLSGSDEHREKAALAGIASSNKANSINIVKSGGIDPLVPILQGSSKQKMYAADAFAQLPRWDDSNSLLIGQTGAIALLIELLQGDDEQKTCAVEALSYLADEKLNRIQMKDQGAIPIFIGCLNGNEKLQEYAAYALSWFMHADDSEAKDYTSEMVELNGIDLLIRLLKGTDAQKTHAADALSCLPWYYNSEDAEKGATPLLVALLNGDEDQKEHAALALSYITWKNELLSREVKEHGGVDPLVAL